MRFRWGWALVVGVAVLLLPTLAFAWGPFTHLLVARSVLEQPGLLPAGLGQLISSFAVDYLYGNLAADFTIAKNLASYHTHAHSWSNAHKLWRHAASDGQRAFALGYLSHLAADTVAHNYFVPLKLVESYHKQFRRHTYWEARFDRESWELVGGDAQLMRRRFPENEALQAQHIPGTLFPFHTNRLLFTGAFRVQGMSGWQNTVGRLARHTPTAIITSTERQEYLGSSVAAIRALFAGIAQGRLPGIDPRGIAAIARAKTVRRQLRQSLSATATPTEIQQLVAEFYRPGFRRAALGGVVLPGMDELLSRVAAQL